MTDALLGRGRGPKEADDGGERNSKNLELNTWKTKQIELKSNLIFVGLLLLIHLHNQAVRDSPPELAGLRTSNLIRCSDTKRVCSKFALWPTLADRPPASGQLGRVKPAKKSQLFELKNVNIYNLNFVLIIFEKSASGRQGTFRALGQRSRFRRAHLNYSPKRWIVLWVGTY